MISWKIWLPAWSHFLQPPRLWTRRWLKGGSSSYYQSFRESLTIFWMGIMPQISSSSLSFSWISLSFWKYLLFVSFSYSTGVRYPCEVAWASRTKTEAALDSHPLRFLAYLARTSWMKLLSSSSCTFSNSQCWLCCLEIEKDQTSLFFRSQICPLNQVPEFILATERMCYQCKTIPFWKSLPIWGSWM